MYILNPSSVQLLSHRNLEEILNSWLRTEESVNSVLPEMIWQLAEEIFSVDIKHISIQGRVTVK